MQKRTAALLWGRRFNGNYVTMSLLLGAILLQSACVRMSPNNERTVALALASENAPALLFIAGLPLDYYCVHEAWPTDLSLPLPLEKKAMFSGVRHLHYHQDGMAYAASFELHSFVPHDDFAVNWHMTIMPPRAGQGLQKIPIIYSARQFHITIPFEYEYACFSQKH